MIINTSGNAYNQVQNQTDPASKTVASQPVESNSSQVTLQPSGQTNISGKGLMMSRLFGNTTTAPLVQSVLTKENMGMDSANFLTTGDRDTLSGLYAQAQQQGADLRYVDDLARDLGSYRMFGGVMSSANEGIYDLTGRKQTFAFTGADSSTANRIVESGNISGSVLDSGFLRHELNAGLSFNHRANFEFIESVVNGAGQNSTATSQNSLSKFATYESQGKNNFVIKTSDEVTLNTQKPDYGSINGVFFVTETGMKNGFRLEDGKVVQNALSPSSQKDFLEIPATLISGLLHTDNSKKKDTEIALTLFDFLYSAKFNKNI